MIQNANERPHPVSALPLTHIAYHVLLALAEAERHGYGIIKYVAKQTGGAVQIEAGTLYAAIKRMREEGWIVQTSPAPGVDGRRRPYAITDYGRQILIAECRRLESMIALAHEAKILPATGPEESM